VLRLFPACGSMPVFSYLALLAAWNSARLRTAETADLSQNREACTTTFSGSPTPPWPAARRTTPQAAGP